jgi:hypothetical protein
VTFGIASEGAVMLESGSYDPGGGAMAIGRVASAALGGGAVLAEAVPGPISGATAIWSCADAVGCGVGAGTEAAPCKPIGCGAIPIAFGVGAMLGAAAPVTFRDGAVSVKSAFEGVAGIEMVSTGIGATGALAAPAARTRSEIDGAEALNTSATVFPLKPTALLMADAVEGPNVPSTVRALPFASVIPRASSAACTALICADEEFCERVGAS